MNEYNYYNALYEALGFKINLNCQLKNNNTIENTLTLIDEVGRNQYQYLTTKKYTSLKDKEKWFSDTLKEALNDIIKFSDQDTNLNTVCKSLQNYIGDNMVTLKAYGAKKIR